MRGLAHLSSYLIHNIFLCTWYADHKKNIHIKFRTCIPIIENFGPTYWTFLSQLLNKFKFGGPHRKPSIIELIIVFSTYVKGVSWHRHAYQYLHKCQAKTKYAKFHSTNLIVEQYGKLPEICQKNLEFQLFWKTEIFENYFFVHGL